MLDQKRGKTQQRPQDAGNKEEMHGTESSVAMHHGKAGVKACQPFLEYENAVFECSAQLTLPCLNQHCISTQYASPLVDIGQDTGQQLGNLLHNSPAQWRIVPRVWLFLPEGDLGAHQVTSR